jgi:hypothetical protein
MQLAFVELCSARRDVLALTASILTMCFCADLLFPRFESSAGLSTGDCAASAGTCKGAGCND